MVPNGSGGELQAALERIVTAFARINMALRTMTDKLTRFADSSQESSERREREFEALRHILTELQKAVALLDGQVEEVRKDQTPIHGFKVYDPAEEKRHLNGSGPALALTADKFKLHMPSSWAIWLLKLALSAGVGAGVLRFAQWVIGHR